MPNPLRILLLEDNPNDAELIEFELRQAGLAFVSERVETETAFRKALSKFSPDLILSDYDLPIYCGIDALAEARKRAPEIPFILVTGAVTEDRAIEVLTSGAKDYVLKNRLSRLVPAVERALSEAEEHKARQKAEKELRAAHKMLEKKVEERTAELKAEVEAKRQAETMLQQYNEQLEQMVDERTAALKAASLYSRSLIEASLDPLVTISLDGKITDVNRATEQVTGRSRPELIGTDFSDYFTQPDSARTGYRKAVAAGEVRDYPLTIRHQSGRMTDVLYNAAVYCTEAGEIGGVFAAARDITDRKLADEAVKLERKRLYGILDTLPFFIILLTPDHHVSFANRFFEERFGASDGRRCFEYVGKQSEPCRKCESFTVLKTKKPHRWQWTGPDNSRYEVFDFPFVDSDGSDIIMEVGIELKGRRKV